ncbi:hypothetical protein E3U55_06405 [Filobacillus milosensis]|uniref:Uncharacterized protein n=1 Tax=Filobacillus milosensis TaxID=94137 RepID=A0A4Y8IQB9_9BACI|nr:hypothetical protein [Filobacillus milosensis]TFB22866.1 hypothetical protein E3U55_06405 [Filobacillus milosensis]
MGEYIGMFVLYALGQFILFYLLMTFIGFMPAIIILIVLIASYIFIWFHVILDELRERNVE